MRWRWKEERECEGLSAKKTGVLKGGVGAQLEQ